MCALFAASASIPVISDLKLIGSDRGLALAITADLPFDAKFAKTSPTTVRIQIANSVYGLNTFSFSNFRDAFPVSKVTIAELKNNTIQIDLTISGTIDIAIETQKKNNQYMALLSRTACPQFRWSAAESDKKDDALQQLEPIEPSKAAVPVTKTEPVMSQTQQKTVTGNVYEKAPVLTNDPTNTSSEARLVNITVIQRNNVCALSFELDRDAQSTVKRVKDTIYLEIEKTKIALRSNSVDVPKGIPYSAIRVKEKTVNSKAILQVAIVMDRKISDLKNGVMLKKEKTITFISGSRTSDKLTQWSTQHGIVLEQSLYNLPSYGVDLKTLEKRALTDAGATVATKGNTFAIQDTPVAEEKPLTSATPVASESGINLTQSYKVPLIVINDNVNIRANASGSATITGKLRIGEKVEQVARKGQWYQVRSGAGTGWIYDRNVVDSMELTDEQQRAIAAALQKIERAQNPEIPVVNEIPKVVENAVATGVKATPAGPVATLEIAEKKQDSSLVDTVRNHVRYVRSGRDPFLPLIVDTTDDSQGANVEHLRLVGILIDNAEQIALLEDLKNDRKPFALRENDRVNRGKVLKIYKDKVVFLLTEFGISRSYTIRLATNQEQEAGR
ncbi:MAG: SH3 domain-containing protein [Fibrobacter sp.]|nr:SH3 domain-containing protein [Fibrobacter sp.]